MNGSTGGLAAGDRNLAAGSGFEPLSSGSEPEILAAERPRCGWEWTNRTPEAGFKDQRLATNRTPSKHLVGPAGIEPAWKEPQSFDLPLIYGPHNNLVPGNRVERSLQLFRLSLSPDQIHPGK